MSVFMTWADLLLEVHITILPNRLFMNFYITNCAHVEVVDHIMVFFQGIGDVK
jgi:hypothetical protein